MIRANQIVQSFLLFLALMIGATASFAHSAEAYNLKSKTCVYIASYAPGYAWQDGISRSIEHTLKGKCLLKTYYMDSKRVFDQQKLIQIGNDAAAFIKDSKPDVVIVSDDHAVKYVLQPHYKDHEIPFVFCGLNDTGKVYGLPYSNTTGMIEKNAIEEFLNILFDIQPAKTHVAFITTQGTTANKDYLEFKQIAEKLNIPYTGYQVENEEAWRLAYKDLQEDPDVNVILFSNNAAFETWDHEKNLQWILENNNKLSIATQHSMMPYVALGMNKVPDEQGHWAALSAIAILEGISPQKIAVIPNREFQFWINSEIVKPFLDTLPDNMVSQSLRYNIE